MTIESLRSRARIVMWLVTIPFAALVVLTVLLIGNILWHGGRFADGVAIYYFPMFLYMWAIWMVRGALRAIADGALFDCVVPTLLRRVGSALFVGAVFTEVGVPLLTWLRDGRPYLATFEASAVTLGIVGAALIVFAGLLERAAELREELDTIF